MGLRFFGFRVFGFRVFGFRVFGFRVGLALKSLAIWGYCFFLGRGRDNVQAFDVQQAVSNSGLRSPTVQNFKGVGFEV